MANTTRDGNFVPGGSIGILEQFDLINSNPLVVALVDANGDQISSFGGGTQYTEGDTDASITGTASMMEGAGNALYPLQGTVADGLLVNLGSNNDVALSATDNAVLDSIDVSSASSASSLSILDDWDNTASDGASVSGDVAHDGVDAGEPVKIGFKAYSPDGTTPGTAVAELDRTNAKGDLDGRLFTNDEHPRWGSYHVDGSSALTDATVVADPGDGFQVVITNICFSSGAATAINMFLEEGSTKIFGPIYLEAVAGRGFCTPAGFKKHVKASTAVTITTSASIAHSVDIQYYIQAV